MSSAESNKMSKKTHSQDSNSEFKRVWMEMDKIEPLTPPTSPDPRNEEDYDTWEYGTEPLPDDHTWRKESANAYRQAATFDHFIFGDYDGYEAYRE
ncbi:hypothetical protein SynMITS9220M01_166 [Synechococcus phage SynMITS9220M01]|jgi:hypothetical protein|nr:hypothetical protein SynMITS9220M01_166 [Synechococcus phage SynMITS9220M01]